ncbi:MAG: hypothetical protein EAX95_14215 [Candidatus Thorarchaeota archaeon]|nr:hypothetical protein [Candidatus Thorarchaeota archaeon]
MSVRRTFFCAAFLLFILMGSTSVPSSVYDGGLFEVEAGRPVLPSEASYFFDRNWTVQLIFVGFDVDIINETRLLDFLPTHNEINYTTEVVRHWLNYNMIFADSEYEEALKDVIQSNSNSSAVGTDFNQTLYQEYIEGFGDAAAAFGSHPGTAIDGAAIETWLRDNPSPGISENAWNLYLLNLTEIDTIDHSQDHWYSYMTTDHDTGHELDWFSLKDGQIVNEVAFQYVGTAGSGRNVLLDPSSNQWYLRYCMTEYNSTLESGESWPLFMSYDLDDVQRLFNLEIPEGVNNLSSYLAEYSSAVISNLFVPGTSSDSGGLNPPTWFNMLLDSVEMHLNVFVMDDGVDPNSVVWSFDESYAHELLSETLLFPRFNLTTSFSRIEDSPGYETLFWRNAMTVNDHTFVNATELIRDLELTFPPAQSWSATRLEGVVFLMSNMTMRTTDANITSVFSEYMFAMCKPIQALYGAGSSLPSSGLTNDVLEATGHILGLNKSSYLRKYVADFGRGVASGMIGSDSFSIFEATAIRMMYLDRLEIQLISDFKNKDDAFPDQATSATNLARTGALREFALADASISEWSWSEAHEHLILARDWAKRMWWSKLDTTRPTISDWGLEGNYTGGESYRAWASVDDTPSGVENVSIIIRDPNNFIVEPLLQENGTHWVVDLPGLSLNGTYRFWIESYDWGMNVATSYQRIVEYSSVPPSVVDPSETFLVVVVSSALFAVVTITLSFIYDRRRKPASS